MKKNLPSWAHWVMRGLVALMFGVVLARWGEPHSSFTVICWVVIAGIYHELFWLVERRAA